MQLGCHLSPLPELLPGRMLSIRFGSVADDRVRSAVSGDRYQAKAAARLALFGSISRVEWLYTFKTLVRIRQFTEHQSLRFDAHGS
jgi:hypothetical protein